ncbi:MAG: flagellar filament capping protein FliD [Lachnospiraceae bacterium]
MANMAILNNVYSYFQSSYMPKTSSKYDAHKRDDLKGIYNSIVKLEKESPVFLLPHSEAIEEYSIHMKKSALRFRDDVANLGGLDQKTMFEQKSVVTSNPDIAEASYINSEVPRDNIEPTELTVSQIATPQTNHGTFLPMSENGIKEGTYSFDVSTNNANYELQFSIIPEDNYHGIQTRLARLINNANIGLNATVAYEGNLSAMVIRSNTMGAFDGDQPFTISDENTSQSRGIVDILGIGNTTQPAQWAKYSIDGEEMVSPTNQITVQNTFSVQLKSAAPEEPVTIDIKPDYESLKENIHGLVGAYNSFIRAASEYLDKQPRTSLLIGSMKRMTSLYENGLNSLGLTQQENGTLDIDDKTLADNISTGSTADSISELKHFTSSVLHKVNQVQLNPMDYVDKRIVAYKNPTKTHFANPYVTSAYSGMLFNSYM